VVNPEFQITDFPFHYCNDHTYGCWKSGVVLLPQRVNYPELQYTASSQNVVPVNPRLPVWRLSLCTV